MESNLEMKSVKVWLHRVDSFVQGRIAVNIRRNKIAANRRFVSFLLPPLFNKTKFHNFKIQNLQQQLGWIFSSKIVFLSI